jgi:hypothetical protein
VRSLRTVEKVFYFSDGAVSQYKNKFNFTTLAHHKEDHGDVEAEWHFFATSHRKGAVDGVGETIKRCATHAILRAVEECPMKTPFEMFEWAKKNINGVQFGYIENTAYENHKQFLQGRTNSVFFFSFKDLSKMISFLCFSHLDQKLYIF